MTMSSSISVSEFPRSGARPVGEPKTSSPARISTGDASVLLVDDDVGVLSALARVLVSEGFSVVTARSGEEALERFRERLPDLLITDLSMGDISGWDLLFHENLHRPTLPIFVITAHPPYLAGGANVFATRFFQKPLDLEALVEAVRRQFEPDGGTRPEVTP